MTGLSNTGILWGTTGGQISCEGLFTALNQTGTFEVMATSQQVPTLSATAVVNVQVQIPTPSPTIVNVALGKPASASSIFSSSFPASLAFDGTNSTRWCAAGNAVPEWLQVDLQSVQILQASQVTFESSLGPWQYYLESTVSDPNQNSPMILVNRTSNTNLGESYYDIIPNVPSRYVRLVITQCSPGHWASVEELALFAS